MATITISRLSKVRLSAVAVVVGLALFSGASNSSDEKDQPSASAAPVAASWQMAAAAPAATKAAVPLQPIRVLTIPCNCSTWVAKEKGFYEAAGLKVTYLPASAAIGSGVLQAIINGNVDTGTVFNFGGFLIGRANGAKAQAVLSGQVSRPGANTQQIARAYVKADSPIKTAADLKGKKVGIWGPGTWAEYVLAGYLEKNGIAPDAVTKVVVPVASAPDALLTGQVDAILMFDVQYAQLLAKGGARLLFTDLDSGLPADKVTVAHIFEESFIAKYPDTVKKFVDVERETQKWMMENVAETQQIIGRVTGNDVSKLPKQEFNYPSCLDSRDVDAFVNLLKKYYAGTWTATSGSSAIRNDMNTACKK